MSILTVSETLDPLLGSYQCTQLSHPTFQYTETIDSWKYEGGEASYIASQDLYDQMQSAGTQVYVTGNMANGEYEEDV